MTDSTLQNLSRRKTGSNIWLGYETSANHNDYSSVQPVKYEVLPDENAVGKAMFEEIERAANEKEGDLVIILLGGRGAQAMYLYINDLAQTEVIDNLLNRLHVFTQDALAPMRMDNGLSFTRDFKRLLGEAFFSKIKSFTPMQTDTNDLEGEMVKYLEKLESLGGVDIFFLG
ncbi:MAG: hypothetical protein H7Z37_12155, partial [Pyrinomonadaceae bacterium]|nr:hypothetical protein [Pyrinomonadaceae bacterium]